LVRISAPEAYNIHPFWPYYQQNMTVAESCESQFGGSMEEYNMKMFRDGIPEQKILQLVIAVSALLAAFHLAKRVWTRTVGSLRTVAVFIVTSYLQASYYHLMSHYQNDLTHLNGNVGHHSEFKVNDNNGALVDSLPHGLVFNFTLNYITSMWMMHMLLKFFKLDAGLYFAISPIVIPAKLLFNMKIIHPYIHRYHKTWYPYPLNLFFRDYDGHVLCHHVTGYCLGDFPGTSFFHDRMMYWHAKLYQLGYLAFGTLEHRIANVLTDYVLFGLTLVMLAALVFVASLLVPPRNRKVKTG